MLSFEYHYGNESEQYTFYRIPKVLVKDVVFKNVSCEAKLLYGLMLDRLSLSLKNGWRDKENRVFIFYTLEDIQDDLNCAHGKAVKLLSELDSIGLINRVKQGQGRPTKIYVKKFIVPVESPKEIVSSQGSQDFRKEEVQTSDNRKCRLPKIGE